VNIYISIYSFLLFAADSAESAEDEEAAPYDLSADAPADGVNVGDSGVNVSGDASSSAAAYVDPGPLPMPVTHMITAEEAASGRYSIDDVVLPLPGSELPALP